MTPPPPPTPNNQGYTKIFVNTGTTKFIPLNR